ncbi:hypothetical protein PIB30_077734 [Stylosanthes scabra]|uniref:Uncharacterized protein n=1 Tax=Stylosanthes scabra TaxID=79078 RepID=A0ABU6RR36_9FABA|nr:hypothetical protein [Stylosanthes scabra]
MQENEEKITSVQASLNLDTMGELEGDSREVDRPAINVSSSNSLIEITSSITTTPQVGSDASRVRKNYKKPSLKQLVRSFVSSFKSKGGGKENEEFSKKIFLADLVSDGMIVEGASQKMVPEKI